MKRYGSDEKKSSLWYENVETKKDMNNLGDVLEWEPNQRPPKYAITSFHFNESTRIAHICFTEEKQKRTIHRYVWRGGKRYPIYGQWKTKTRIIKKSIKLTNETLESLCDNDDELICEFSREIIERLDNESLVPSWYRIETLGEEQEKELKTRKALYNCKQIKEQDINNSLHKERDKLYKNKEELKDKLYKDVQREERLNKKLETALDKKHMLLLSIISFGIYPFFLSQKRITSIQDGLSSIKKTIATRNAEIAACNDKIQVINIQIQNRNDRIIELDAEFHNEIESLKTAFEKKISLLQPLSTNVTVSTMEGFIPLNTVCGMNYEKIVGCYVIRNRENGKCYVGQSKDVLKRICKQHFNGTEIKNIIFAEDYYASKMENKSDLFEVKIIKLNSKADLDQKERELIEEYDSFYNGYNGTKGNT